MTDRAWLSSSGSCPVIAVIQASASRPWTTWTPERRVYTWFSAESRSLPQNNTVGITARAGMASARKRRTTPAWRFAFSAAALMSGLVSVSTR